MDEWKAHRADAQRQQRREAEAALIARWRARHPEATCSDATVLALVSIEAIGRRVE